MLSFLDVTTLLINFLSQNHRVNQEPEFSWYCDSMVISAPKIGLLIPGDIIGVLLSLEGVPADDLRL